jgi:hypothetical protein
MQDIIQNAIYGQEMYLDSLYYRQKLTKNGIKSRFSNLNSIKTEIREMKKEIKVLKNRKKGLRFVNEER